MTEIDKKFDIHSDKDLDHRNPEVLKELLYGEGMVVKDVARKLDTTESVIRDWMGRNGIKKPINNEDFLRDQVEKGMTTKEIAEKINEHWTDVYAKLNHFGIINNGN